MSENCSRCGRSLRSRHSIGLELRDASHVSWLLADLSGSGPSRKTILADFIYCLSWELLGDCVWCAFRTNEDVRSPPEARHG